MGMGSNEWMRKREGKKKKKGKCLRRSSGVMYIRQSTNTKNGNNSFHTFAGFFYFFLIFDGSFIIL